MSAQQISVPVSKSSSIAGKLSGLYCRFKHYAAWLESPFLLFVRLYWGWQFIQDGWGKLNHLARVRDYFTTLGIPAPGLVAPSISTLEFVGGILLVIGLATRLTGFLLACNMFTAYVTGDREALMSIISDPGKFYNADPFTYLFASVIVLIFGAGFFSLDYLFSHRRKR